MPDLDQKDARVVVALLGLLQDHLESAIESATSPGPFSIFEGQVPSNTRRWEYQQLRSDRRAWRRAEDVIRKLESTYADPS